MRTKIELKPKIYMLLITLSTIFLMNNDKNTTKNNS